MWMRWFRINVIWYDGVIILAKMSKIQFILCRRNYNQTMDTSLNGNIFRIAGPLCWEFTGHWWISLTKASDAELWCFVWSAPEQMVEQTIETPVIWDAVALIMTSLWYDITQWLLGWWYGWYDRRYMIWKQFKNTHAIQRSSVSQNPNMTISSNEISHL